MGSNYTRNGLIDLAHGSTAPLISRGRGSIARLRGMPMASPPARHNRGEGSYLFYFHDLTTLIFCKPLA